MIKLRRWMSVMSAVRVLRTLSVLFVLGIGVTLLILVVVWAPQKLVSEGQLRSSRGSGLSPTDQVSAENNVRTTLVQAFGGILLLVGATFTIRQLKISRDQLNANLAQQAISSELSRATLEASLKGQEDQAWTRAIDQLGAASLPSQLGGIASLERLAASGPLVRNVVMEVLTAYIRERVPRVVTDDNGQAGWWGEPSTKVPVEVELSLRVLGRLRSTEPSLEELSDITDRRLLDFDATQLRGANLTLGHYEGAMFRRSDLAEANLSGGFFESAVFFRALGMRANFAGNFAGASFDECSLESADFHGADLYAATFVNANLTSARFVSSDIRGADFSGAVLDHTNFSNAVADEETTWPGDFDPVAHGVQTETSDDGGVSNTSPADG